MCAHCAVGQNNQAGKSILKTDYKPENTVEQNLKVAVKILLKTMDSTTPSPERIELSTLKKTENGEIVHYTLSDAEVRVAYLFVLAFVDPSLVSVVIILQLTSYYLQEYCVLSMVLYYLSGRHITNVCQNYCTLLHRCPSILM